MGRIDQAVARAKALREWRAAHLAERVANGATVTQAGEALGLTKGETARTWANIKKSLGVQAR